MTRDVLYRRRSLRSILLIVVGLLPLAIVSVLGLRIFLRERAYLHPKHGRLRISLAEAAVDGMHEIAISSGSGSRIAAWYAPSRNGVNVILMHGTSGDRSDVLDEVRILRSVGTGIIAFDFPGHGLSTGRVEWGKAERDALSAVVSWLTEQPGLDSSRIGAVGFSFGGHVLAQVAAKDRRIRAVALLGTPASPTDLVRWEYRHWGPVAVWLALRADEFLYPEPDTIPARSIVSQISPRRLLIVSGTADDVVPPDVAQDLFDAAKEPKQILIVPNAQHGAYASPGSSRYAEVVQQFFSPAAFGSIRHSPE